MLNPKAAGLWRTSAASLVAGSMLALAAGAATAKPASAFQDVRIGVVSDTATTPLFVAMEKGYFFKQGLNGKLQIFSSGSDMNKALAAGNIDLATASTTSIPSSRSAGLLTKLVSNGQGDATTAKWDGALGIIGSKKQGIQPKDANSLKGKKVGYLAGSTGEAYLRAFLSKHNMTMKDIDPISLPVPDHPVSLKQGDIAASVGWEPFLSKEARELGNDAVVVSRGDGLLGYLIGAAGTDESIAKHPELMQKFVNALAQGAYFTRQHPQQAAEIYTHFVSGVNVLDAAEAIKNHLSFDPRLSLCSAEALHATAERMFKSGQIKKEIPTKDMYTTQFIDHTEKTHPKWFSDLPKIPAECQFKP